MINLEQLAHRSLDCFISCLKMHFCKYKGFSEENTACVFYLLCVFDICLVSLDILCIAWYKCALHLPFGKAYREK